MANKPHYHHDDQGMLVKCFHHCRNLITDYQFWIGVTLSYPIEHYLWEHVWPFSLVKLLLGI